MDVLYNETPWRPAPREGCRQVVLSSTIGQLNVIRAGVDGRPLHWCRFGLSGGDGQWHSRTGIASWHVFDRCYVFHPLGFAWGSARQLHPGPPPWREFQWFVSVPHWALALAFAALPAWRFGAQSRMRRRRRTARGLCARCGYDLTGNASGVCPECGTPAASRWP